jgi:hypothetical protein
MEFTHAGIHGALALQLPNLFTFSLSSLNIEFLKTLISLYLFIQFLDPVVL